MRGLMMGRIQPFSLGHLDLARQILEQCDKVIVAITSFRFNYLEKDPFTSGKRTGMIHSSLKEPSIDLDGCFVILVENQSNAATWASCLKSVLPHFDKVYGKSNYVLMLLADSGIAVVRLTFLERNQFGATKTRFMIVADEEWKHSVPNTVYEFSTKINAKNLLKVISKSDANPTEH